MSAKHVYFLQKMQKERCVCEKMLLIGEMQSREYLFLYNTRRKNIHDFLMVTWLWLLFMNYTYLATCVVSVQKHSTSQSKRSLDTLKISQRKIH